jgi:hypothetical protein
LYLFNDNTYFPKNHYFPLYQFVEPTGRVLKSLAQGLPYYLLAQGSLYYITGTGLASLYVS